MTFEVVAMPEDEDAMEAYRFAFNGSTLVLRLTGYFKRERSNETAPWHDVGHWTYPDMHGESTLEQPETIPEWARQDAFARITSQITIDNY